MPCSDESVEEIDQDEAEELLMKAVDNIATVQDGYDDLSQGSDEMLRESKAGIASVHLHLRAEGPVIDLDL